MSVELPVLEVWFDPAGNPTPAPHGRLVDPKRRRRSAPSPAPRAVPFAGQPWWPFEVLGQDADGVPVLRCPVTHS